MNAMLNLGTWVEFDVVMVQIETALGAQHARLPIDETQRGQVSGVRCVYESDDPLVGPLRRETVLMITTERGHTCEVLPADARPIAAPSHALATAGSAALQSKSRRRSRVTQAALVLIVAEEITRLVSERRAFTAYEITQAIRAAQPGLDIRHARVRSIVHRYMAQMVAGQIYARGTAVFGGNPAICYLPL